MPVNTPTPPPQSEAAPIADPLVFVASVEHRHGANLYAAISEAELYADLADYCRSDWNDRSHSAPESPDGLSDRAVVDAYFDGNEREFLNTGRVPLAGGRAAVAVA